MRIAVLGFGVVGRGVWEMLNSASGLEPGKVLVRPGKAVDDFMVSSIEDICSDESIDAVAEVMGGISPAFEYCSAALEAGKHVVTSNKALVAAKGPELSALAAEKGVAFLFSAACGGAVPFLHNLELASESDTILSMGGILNGTTNYMLDSMQSNNQDYASALKDAQALGYAEADPTADVSGLDALRKIMLACAVAYNKLPVTGLLNEGIEYLEVDDIDDFKSRGLVCRLITSAGQADGKVFAYVEPVLFPASAPEGSVVKNFNMAAYVGKNSGRISFMGQGAGRYPTASAVIRDLSCILAGQKVMMRPDCTRVESDCGACRHSYYVRLPAKRLAELPAINAESDGVIARAVTRPVSVAEMHAMAADVREKGGKIFFAELRE